VELADEEVAVAAGRFLDAIKHAPLVSNTNKILLIIDKFSIPFSTRPRRRAYALYHMLKQ